MSRLVYLAPLALLYLMRRTAAALLVDALGHPQRWQVVALGTFLVFALTLAAAGMCAAVLVWHHWRYEVPANRRRKARP